MIEGDKQALDYVRQSFETLHESLRERNRKGFFDAAKKCEALFCKLLNTVYGWNLVNLNDRKLNNKAIDLGDEAQKVCVQITSCQEKHKREKVEKNAGRFREARVGTGLYASGYFDAGLAGVSDAE